MINVYSVISSIIFYNLGLMLLFILRRNTDFIARYAISTLVFLATLSIIRLLAPLDIAPIIIRSKIVAPRIIDFWECKHSFWPLSVGDTLLAIWIFGTVFYLLRLFVLERNAYKIRKLYPIIKSKQLEKISNRFDKQYTIKISPEVSQPYTLGIFRPVVYLPYIEYSDSELYFILLHEIQHIKSRDNLTRLLFLIMEAVFWWNPLAHMAVNEFELLTEYKCDSLVTASMDNDTVVAYLRTIVYIFKRLNPDEDKKAKPSLALMFAQTYDIKQRFEVLLRRNYRKPKYIRYSVWLLLLAIFILSFFVIIQPYYSAPSVFSEEDMSAYEECSYILFSDNKYFLVLDNVLIGELSEIDLNYPPCNELMIIGE